MRAVFRARSYITLCLALSASCNAYKASLLETSTPGCTLAEESRTPPKRPHASTNDGQDIPEVVFAHRDVRFNQLPDAWKEIGLNLDGRCSTPENALSECARGSGATQLDGVGGIDNVFGSQLFTLVSLQYKPRPDVPNDSLETYAIELQASGESVLLVRIRNWNGRADDSHVSVDISSSVFGIVGTGDPFTPPSSAPCMDGPGGDCTPAWAGDGDDWFWARSDNFLIGDPAQPKILDDNAYIANDTLVMSIPDRSEIKYTGPTLGLAIVLTEGVAVGEISPDRMTMSTTVSGRWSRNDLVETAEYVGVCAGTATYDILQRALTGMLDVRSDRASAGSDVPCDALTMALPSTGYRARFGGVVVGPDILNGCD
jgi:hypothetical protein